MHWECVSVATHSEHHIGILPKASATYTYKLIVREQDDRIVSGNKRF